MKYRRYPQYKESGVEWLGEVPAHWEIKSLSGILDRNDGGVWGKELENDEGVIVLRSTEQNIDGTWAIEDPARRKLTKQEIEASLLYEGDLVVTKSSGSAQHIGKTSYVTQQVANLNCCFSNFMQRLRPKRIAQSQYLFYVLNNWTAREQFDYYSSSTTGLANLNRSVIGQVKLALPPEQEIDWILTFLDHETAQIDALIAKQERLIAALQEKRQALISHAVTKGLDPAAPMKDSGVEWLGPVPAHWEVVPISYRYEVQLGKMLDEKRITGNHLAPYVKNVDVQWDSINTSDLPEMDFTPEERTKYALRPGDLLVCEGGEVGRAAVWQGQLAECYYQKAIHRVRRRDSNSGSPRFLFYVLYAAAQLGVFVATGNPNTIDHLTAEKLRAHRLAFPPADEQSQVVEFLDRSVHRLDQIVTRCQKAIALLRERRAALIAAAVTGKIDVRGPG